MQKSRSSIQKYIAVYLIINGLFILPADMIYISEDIAGFLFRFSFFSAMTFFVGYYYLFGLGYVHLALNAGFPVYSVIKFIKERNWFMFIVSVLAAAFSAWANIFMLQH